MVNDTALTKAKTELRNSIKSRLAAIPAQQFTAAGSSAALLLPAIPGWDTFRSVLAFFPMKDEIDTRPLMEIVLSTGKSLFVPQIKGETLVFCQIDQYNREPAEDLALTLKPADFPALVITPGLAFDRTMNRLGRGRSFYDRFLASLDAANREYTALGLCMECQLLDKIPAEPWDKKMDMLLTESGFNMIA